jgi:glycosyltransferase involved in cell wall biosynthesis
MKVLQLCNKIPYPEKDGGALGVSVFSNALAKAGCQVKMLAMNTKKHYIDIRKIPESFISATNLEAVNVDTNVKLGSALLALISGKSYNISRFHSAEYERKLSAILENEQFDVIQLEGIYLAPYINSIRKLSKAPIVLRAHNVEWKIWKRLADEEKVFFKRIYLKVLAKQLRKYEEQAINLCDGITTTTINDSTILKEMGCKTPIIHIPFGIDIKKYAPMPPSNDKKSLFYIGALDWLPNIQGIDWFINTVWSKVHEALPDVTFHVAGRNMPEEMKKRSFPGIVFHGEIDDVFTFVKQYNIMLVPLLAGSGIRVKIIEGMALGKPIITTLVGVEGIDCKYGSDVLIANTTSEFVQAIKRCVEEVTFSTQLAENARRFAETHHDIDKITQNLISFYKKRITKKTKAN